MNTSSRNGCVVVLTRVLARKIVTRAQLVAAVIGDGTVKYNHI